MCGMFDYINFEMECPICKTKVDGFQSKDGSCSLHKISPFEVFNFYSTCPKCGTWIEFNKRYIKPIKEPEIILLDAVLRDFDMKIKERHEK